ncbi:MAG TPA: GNAT family protein [Anaerolineales bacterium]|jgi:RimJ/RimL family protein N-acetyltransferase
MSIIYGERVRLRAVERTDLPKFFEWVNDPEVTLGLGMYLPMSNADEEKWFEGAQTRDANEKPLAVEIKEGDGSAAGVVPPGWKLIGSCGVFGIEWVNRSAELGILIGDKSIWNKGYGTEVMRLLLRHGFETLNLNRLFLRVYAANARAFRAYVKAGFVEEGRMREGVFKNGRYDDIIVMSVLRSEWKTQES